MCENYNVITTEICESSQNADSSMRTFCLFYNFQLRSIYTVDIYNFLQCSYSPIKRKLGNGKSCECIVSSYLPEY